MSAVLSLTRGRLLNLFPDYVNGGQLVHEEEDMATFVGTISHLSLEKDCLIIDLSVAKRRLRPDMSWEDAEAKVMHVDIFPDIDGHIYGYEISMYGWTRIYLVGAGERFFIQHPRTPYPMEDRRKA